jgi:glycosyltransferase involved in cell wall biosynthesis
MENSLVSIIIPVYNAERYISRCLDSIAGQSFQPMEVIIVDDNRQHLCYCPGLPQ